MAVASRRVLPGFSLSLGITLAYLSLLVLLPLSAAFIKAAGLSGQQIVDTVWSDRARAAYWLTFGASFIAALANAAIGFLLAWVLVRYPFPGRKFLDSLIDLPFALPTAVAGLVYSSLYAKNGWLGQFLEPIGIQGAFSRLGIVLVLIFTGLPFVVRTLQPVLENLDAEFEEAAGSLGASRWQTFRYVLLPCLTPPLLTGFALAFARALGEYGSVIFIAGNMPYRTEIAPVLIVGRLEEFAYAEATALAVVLLLFSFVLLGVINLLQRWSQSYGN
ncbi:MAG: sulfate ABC transporter permease subunit CysT [Gemmataceae bacterium]|nr:sulfate ABC transporter permease subunit CysT [Gemmataceae bacterium]